MICFATCRYICEPALEKVTIEALSYKSFVMSAIYILIAAGLAIAGGFLFVFLWAVKSGQFDDDITPSIRILFDDEEPQNNSG